MRNTQANENEFTTPDGVHLMAVANHHDGGHCGHCHFGRIRECFVRGIHISCYSTVEPSCLSEARVDGRSIHWEVRPLDPNPL